MRSYGEGPVVFVLLFGTSALLAIIVVQVVATPWKYAIVALPLALLAGLALSFWRTVESPDSTVSSR